MFYITLTFSLTMGLKTVIPYILGICILWYFSLLDVFL
jgi:hypothetical protein